MDSLNDASPLPDPHNTSQSAKPAELSLSRILELPIELRSMIWEYTLKLRYIKPEPLEKGSDCEYIDDLDEEDPDSKNMDSLDADGEENIDEDLADLRTPVPPKQNNQSAVPRAFQVHKLSRNEFWPRYPLILSWGYWKSDIAADDGKRAFGARFNVAMDTLAFHQPVLGF